MMMMKMMIKCMNTNLGEGSEEGRCDIVSIVVIITPDLIVVTKLAEDQI